MGYAVGGEGSSISNISETYISTRKKLGLSARPDKSLWFVDSPVFVGFRIRLGMHIWDDAQAKYNTIYFYWLIFPLIDHCSTYIWSVSLSFVLPYRQQWSRQVLPICMVNSAANNSIVDSSQLWQIELFKVITQLVSDATQLCGNSMPSGWASCTLTLAIRLCKLTPSDNF